jgi:hypothetical protein
MKALTTNCGIAAAGLSGIASVHEGGVTKALSFAQHGFDIIGAH